ncbi:MAG: rubredoxin [Actinobacteria bacterium]|nr:rubredoxin [Actinomycetota bacterium]
MTDLLVSSCRACGHASFPPRSLCPRCGSPDLRAKAATAGTVEEATLRAPLAPGSPPIPLISVRTDLGPVVIARLVGAEERDRVPAVEGARVSLSAKQGAPVARLGP